MVKKIVLTPDGGFFYRATIFHWISVIILTLPISLILLIALLNPLWFRNDLLLYIEKTVNRLTQWRNYYQYKIYLGCDPRLWHSLKDQ